MGDVRRVTWIAGDQRVLVEEVVDTIRAGLNVSEVDSVSLSHGAFFDQQVWAAANQFPLTPGGKRLVVVRDAERLKSLEPLERWMERTRQLPGVYLVFVSNELSLPNTKVIRTPRGCMVKCVALPEDDAVAWVRRRAPMMSAEVAAYLLARVGGDLGTAAQVCAKVSLFAGAPGSATIDQLCTERPGTDLADNLLAGRKRKALLCVPDLDEHEMHKLVPLLDSRLVLLQRLYRVQIAGQSYRDLSGVSPFLARQYLPLAKEYDPKRCAHRRQVLAVVDDALRHGARTGVFEGLIALW